MTRDEHQAKIIMLKVRAEAAQADGRLAEAMLIASNVAELILDHPEFWPDSVDHAKLKSDCERMIASIDKQLGMQ
jgi:hypothetical protein